MTEHTFNQAKCEAFGGSMVNMLNNAGLTLMTSIGHRTGLFQTMAALPPAGSEDIAEAAGLHERYVREWLGAMVTGQVVEYAPETATYRLPAEHAAVLTPAAGPDNFARVALFIPLLGQVEDQAVDCFTNGGGIAYSAYPRFQQVMAESSGAVYDAALVDAIVPTVPGLAERLQAGIEVADVGCGQGHAINLLAKAFPESRFSGYDLSEQAIDTARREAEGLGVGNARFEARDVISLDARGTFGLITAFDAIHDLPQPDRVLAAVADALAPGGTFLMVDWGASSHVHENFEFPIGPLLYAISCMHCVPVSMGQNGPGLGAMWGEQVARQMLTEAGFSTVDVKQVEGDVLNNYFIATKAA